LQRFAVTRLTYSPVPTFSQKLESFMTKRISRILFPIKDYKFAKF